jgi:hypothetical protein
MLHWRALFFTNEAAATPTSPADVPQRREGHQSFQRADLGRSMGAARREDTYPCPHNTF